jgi:hypothetical protein
VCVQQQPTLPESSANLLRAMDRWSGGGALSSEMYPTELEESTPLGLAVDNDDHDAMNRSYARIDSAGKGQQRPVLLRGLGAAAASAAAYQQEDRGPAQQVRSTACVVRVGACVCPQLSALLPLRRAQSAGCCALCWRIICQGMATLIHSLSFAASWI